MLPKKKKKKSHIKHGADRNHRGEEPQLSTNQSKSSDGNVDKNKRSSNEGCDKAV